MRILSFVTGFLLLIAASSCQKGVDWTTNTPGQGNGGGTGGGGGGTGGGNGLLVKMVVKSIIDTTTNVFAYDNNQKLVYHSVKLQGPLSSGDFRKHISWDAQGRASVMKDSSLQPGGTWDTSRTTVYYNGTTATALYALVSSTGISDSIVFTYTSGRITKATRHHKITGIGGTYFPEAENVYTYDASGNVATVKHYDLTGATPSLESEGVTTYDAKVSPFQLGAAALLIYSFGAIEGGEGMAGPNNTTKSDDTDYSVGTAADVTTITYTYLSNNKPSGATTSFKAAGSPVGLPGSIEYTYQ